VRVAISQAQLKRMNIFCRYVELNPVRARMVAKASDYPWSSYYARMTGEGKLIPDFDPCYQALGDSAEKRSSRYLDYLNTEIPFGECAFIQDAVDRGQLTGNRRILKKLRKSLVVELSIVVLRDQKKINRDNNKSAPIYPNG